MKKAVLFDLDGTLTDPFEGITKCIEYALAKYGVACPPPEELARYIGPPLHEGFAELLGNPRKEVVWEVLDVYRDRFASKGIYENRVYPGIVELLRGIREKGWRAYVASSKPLVYAVEVVDHFSLDEFFEGVYGSNLDGTRTRKGELIGYLLQEESIAPTDAIMVGDRSHDVVGALENGLPAIGVTWGFGSEDELREAGAARICDDPASVLKALEDCF